MWITSLEQLLYITTYTYIMGLFAEKKMLSMATKHKTKPQGNQSFQCLISAAGLKIFFSATDPMKYVIQHPRLSHSLLDK